MTSTYQTWVVNTSTSYLGSPELKFWLRGWLSSLWFYSVTPGKF
jgi:hypothetical protein